ncbi:AMP-binding protein [Streptomyces sp. NPDC057651]|uniref:AMP-binding protein n=1 Tax=unclassified Streptomyces TaxID=2593676 RepID=UPI003691A208
MLVPASDAAPAPAEADLSGTPLDELLKTAPGEPEGMSGDDVAHLSFTGGTTGRSKAVRVLHRNLVANVLQMGSWRGAARPVCDELGYIHLEHIPKARTPHTLAIGESTAVALAPMFHAMGLVSQSVSVAAGLTVVIAGRFGPRKFVRLVEERGVNTLPGSPALFHGLLALPGIEDADLSSVKLVNSGAAPIDTNALKQLHGLFPNACVVEGYGLTEATMALTTHPLPRDNPVPLGSVGAPLFDTELEIRELGCGPVVPAGVDQTPAGDLARRAGQGGSVGGGPRGPA